MKKLSRDILYLEFVIENRSSAYISKKYGISQRTISSWIKSYNLRKKYTEKIWLENEFIIKNKSLSEISRENGVSKGTLSTWISKHNLVKMEMYKNKQWLIIEYLDKNRTAEEIGLEQGVSGETIRFWIKRFEIVKADSDKNKKFIETMNFKYGKVWPCKDDVSKEKRALTLIKKGTFHIYNIDGHNKTLKDISSEYKIPYSTITGWINGKRIIDNESLKKHIKGWKTGVTSLESYFSDLYDIPIFNKKIKNSDLRYRPDFKLSENIYLNVDGLYWHSKANRFKPFDRKYHFNMRKEYEDCGLRIIQIRADEIIYKSDIIKSMINVISHKIKKRIYARKCFIRKVYQSEANDFYEKNHLMGSIKAKHIGLIYEGKVVSLLSIKEFSNKIKIERFSSQTETIVVGGFSKLLKSINTNKDIHYWVDLRYGTGIFLKSMGFKHKRDTLGWKWTNLVNTYNRLSCRANMDERKLSEKVYAFELKWYKIYDAGQRLYILEQKHNERSL